MKPLQTILCALDFGRDSEAAAVRAADLAERAGADLHLVHVDPVPRTAIEAAPDGPLEQAFTQRLAVAVDAALGAAGAFDVLGPTVHVVHGQAASDAVVRLAEEIEADVLVLGTHAVRGLTRAFAGSTAAETVRRSAVPVWVVPEACGHAPGPDRPVLAAVDFSDLTAPTLDHAATLAAAFEADVEPVHVLDGPADAPLDLGGLLTLGDLKAGPGDDAKARASRALRQLARRADLDAGAVHVTTGEAGVAIVRLARERKAGAIVLGTHGRTGWDRVRLGSVAEWVVRHAPCPVLTVPASLVASESAAQ